MGYNFNPFTGNFDETGGGGTPGGTDTQVQFNDAGALNGDAGLVFNKTTNKLTAGGDVELNDGGTFTTTLQTVTPTAARTISFPDATGTVGLVAGSSGQLLYNASGANAGASTLTYDGSILTSSGRFINSYNATASSPAKAFTGTWFTGGTSTTTKPQVVIEPPGATSTGWSTSGTGLGVNAASGFAGRLIDLQVNGTGSFNVQSGTATMRSVYLYSGDFIVTRASLGTNTNTAVSAASRGMWFGPTVSGSILGSDQNYQWSSQSYATGTSDVVGTADTALTRSAAAVVKVTNGSTGDGTLLAQHRLAGAAPANATATGTAGDIRYDADYIYICTATNTWKRAAITTWV